MKTSESKRSETRVKGDFNLEVGLPAELAAIKPRWTVPVSANYSVLVYDSTVIVQQPNDEGHLAHRKVPAYVALLLHNKSGLPHRSVSMTGYTSRRRDCQATFTSLLELRIAIDDVSVQLRPKTTTVQVDSDEDA